VTPLFAQRQAPPQQSPGASQSQWPPLVTQVVTVVTRFVVTMVLTGAGVGATIVTVVVDFGLMLKHLHADEISPAAYWASAAGATRASRAWTGA
jgi:hypothetical protein